MSQHYISEISEAKRTALCAACGKIVPVNRNSARGKGWVCAVKARDDAAAYRAANPDKIKERWEDWRDANPGYRRRLRDLQLQRLYGITIDEYEAEVSRRNGRCDICGQVPSGSNPNEQSLCVDHVRLADGTVIIRGYLCAGCNAGLGRFRDDPARLRQAAAYLEREVSPWAELPDADHRSLLLV